MDELDIISWLHGRVGRSPAVRGVPLGVGDDMAMVFATGAPLLLSSDMLLDGVHFDAAKQDPALIGRKTVACSLSDCAAMAVRPVALLVSVALPKSMDRKLVEQLFEGMFEIAGQFDTAIVGGDTTRWDQPLAIDVSITAEPYDGIEPVKRSGARNGDRLYVTGALGGSAAGRHLTFTPRIKEAECIARSLGRRLHAMLDVSDGLSLDLWRMCEASGVGAVLREDRLCRVISPEAEAAAKNDGRSPLDHALSDGEDFELLLAVEGAAEVPSVPLFEVGKIERSGLGLRATDETVRPLKPAGFVH